MSTTEQPSKPEVAIAKRSIAMTERGLQLRSLDDAFRFAKYVIESGLAPKGITRPEQALIAMQAGAELGFSPMRSLAAITVINGRAGLMGDAALAKIHESNVCLIPPLPRLEGDGDERRGVVRFQRKDMPGSEEVSFSVADAKRAHLWGKSGPWTEYSDDMLIWRAIGRMIKRYFGDVTMGLVIAEELRDYPIEHEMEPPPGPDPLLENAQSPEPITEQVHKAEIISEKRVSATKEKETGAQPVESNLPQPASTIDGAAASATTAATSDEISEDEAAFIRAVERFEGAMTTAESKKNLDKAWRDGQPLVKKMAPTAAMRATKLYEQLRSNFK